LAAAQGSPFSRYRRRLAYILQHSLAFFLTSFNISLQTLGLPRYMTVVNNVVLISPIMGLLNVIIYFTLVCPTCVTNRLDQRTAVIISLIGLLLVMTSICVSFVLLVFAAIYTIENDYGFGILYIYILEVQVVSFFQELLFAALMNVSTFHLFASMSIPQVSQVLSLLVGARYIERVLAEKLTVNVDYTDNSLRLSDNCLMRLVGCFITFDWVYPRQSSSFKEDEKMIINPIVVSSGSKIL
jgi:hypothetical protein